MDFAKLLLLMLYLLIATWSYYVISTKDCDQAFYFIKILLLLILFEAALVLRYNSPCEALRVMCSKSADLSSGQSTTIP